MTCPHCGNPFTPTRRWQKFYSHACRCAANDARNAQKKRTRRYGPDSLPAEVRQLRESRVLELQAKYAGWAV